MTGTHDTEPLSVWWETAEESDRIALLALMHPLRHQGGTSSHGGDGWTPDLRDRFITLVYGSGSDDLFLPIQDLFGWKDRVNVPGTVGPENWTWCLPWPVEELSRRPETRERAAFLRERAADAHRGQPV